MIAKRTAEPRLDLFVPYITDLPLRDTARDDGAAVFQPGQAQAPEADRICEPRWHDLREGVRHARVRDGNDLGCRCPDLGVIDPQQHAEERLQRPAADPAFPGLRSAQNDRSRHRRPRLPAAARRAWPSASNHDQDQHPPEGPQEGAAVQLDRKLVRPGRRQDRAEPRHDPDRLRLVL